MPQTILKTVLVVDDEEIVSSVIGEIVQELGMKALTAVNGCEGLMIVRERSEEIDLVVLDMRMPRMDGSEALIAMRRHNPNLKVLLCTTFCEDDISMRQAMSYPHIHYVRKPFSIQELSEKITSIVNEPYCCVT